MVTFLPSASQRMVVPWSPSSLSLTKILVRDAMAAQRAATAFAPSGPMPLSAEAQLLDLADCAHAQRIAQYDGALVAQVVPADQNFGQGRTNNKTQNVLTLCNSSFAPHLFLLTAAAQVQSAPHAL